MRAGHWHLLIERETQHTGGEREARNRARGGCEQAKRWVSGGWLAAGEKRIEGSGAELPEVRVGSSRSLNLAALERLEQHSDDSTNRSKTASKQRLEAQRAGLIVVDPRGRKAAITAVSRARCAGFQQLYRRRGKRLGVALLRSEIHPAVHFIGAVPFYAKQQSEAK